MTSTAVHTIYCLAPSSNAFLSSIDTLNSLGHYQYQPFFDHESLMASIAASPPDLLLIDLDDEQIFSGLEKVLSAVSNLLHDNYLPIIALTVNSESQRLLQALENGVDDFINPTWRYKIIQKKIATFTRMRRMQTTLKQQHEAIDLNHKQLLVEQQIAKEVFDKVAHDGCIDIPNIQHWLSPIAVFNGDILLSTITPGGNLLVLLGDFTGHGLPAAIGAMPLASTFYGMAQKGFSMQDILKELNKKLYEILPVSVFCCAGMMHIDFEKGIFEVCNAGLPDCILVRGEQSLTDKPEDGIALIASQNLALGILKPREFKPQIQTFSALPGDRLFLMSDGILEAPNQHGEMYGDKRLLDYLQQHKASNTLFKNLKQHIEQFIDQGERVDDISLVEVSMIDAGQFKALYEQDDHAFVQQPVSWSLSYEVRHESLQNQDPIPLLLHMLMEVPRLRFYSGQLFSILTELFVNALDHGLLGLSSELKNSQQGFAEYFQLREQRLANLNEGAITFTLDYRGDTQNGVLAIDVIDTGSGFDYAKYKTQSQHISPEGSPQLHGRGIPLLESLCNDVEYLGTGNHARVSFEWHTHTAEQAYV